MKKNQKHPIMIFLIFTMALIACTDEIITDPTIPSNLVVKVNRSSADQKVAIIEAKAENAVEYQLHVGPSVQTNTTGIFSQAFTENGTWDLDVRAYGSSGRYLRELVPFSIQTDPETKPEVTIDQGYFSPSSYEGYQMVWNDEFDGTTVNSNYWVFEIGTGCPNVCGWGNDELQYYRRENAWIKDGVLTIEARKENFQGSQYTSSRMKTQGKKSFKYGRIDIRALMPQGQGIWPALWMLGNSITEVSWPACGEIDIMEMVGGKGRENQTHGTLHWDANGHAQTGSSYRIPEGTLADQYHVYSIEWNETHMKWFVNNYNFHTIDITPAHMSEFHEEFFFIFNIAVGGRWPGNPDSSTIFPQQMKVDYIRVFQKTQ
jgi:beta-glucanase (GH16 family)